MGALLVGLYLVPRTQSMLNVQSKHPIRDPLSTDPYLVTLSCASLLKEVSADCSTHWLSLYAMARCFLCVCMSTCTAPTAFLEME